MVFLKCITVTKIFHLWLGSMIWLAILSNIVLARILPACAAGTKGISLFIVPNSSGDESGEIRRPVIKVVLWFRLNIKMGISRTLQR